MRENKLTVKALALLLFLGLPIAVQAQSAPSCTPLVESCGPAPIPPDLQQREQQIDRQLQADAAQPLEQQLSAQQQALEQQQALFAQQDQARAEQEQANTMWQEQMNQTPNPYDQVGAAVGTGIGLAARALIEHHREKVAEQQEQALQQQFAAVITANRNDVAKERALDEIAAEVNADQTKLQASTEDMEAITLRMNVLVDEMAHATTRKQGDALMSEGNMLHARANADRAEQQSVMADLDKLQQQVNAINASNP